MSLSICSTTVTQIVFFFKEIATHFLFSCSVIQYLIIHTEYIKCLRHVFFTSHIQQNMEFRITYYSYICVLCEIFKYLDPIPTVFIKENLHCFICYVLDIVNCSLEIGIFLNFFKYEATTKDKKPRLFSP